METQKLQQELDSLVSHMGMSVEDAEARIDAHINSGAADTDELEELARCVEQAHYLQAVIDGTYERVGRRPY